MKTKNYLLPHNFQKIGWGVFIFSLILLIGCRYASIDLMSFDHANNYIPSIILYIIMMIAEYFVAFSREKIEDELIQVMRYTSIVFTVITGFILYTIVLAFFAFNKSHPVLPKNSYGYLMVVNPVTLFILYVIIFRTRLIISKRGMQNAE